MASKDSCPKVRPMVGQLLKTLEEFELSSKDSGLTGKEQNTWAIEKLRGIVENFMPEPTSTHVEEQGSKPHVRKSSPTEEKSQVYQQHEKLTICLGTEDGKRGEEESTSKSPKNLEKNTSENLSILASAAEPENEELEKHLLELDMKRCVLVYCKICNKQFSEKFLARQHIQEVHLQRNTINDKPESELESQKEQEKEPEEMPVQNEIDSACSFTMANLLPQETDSISIQQDGNNQVETLQKSETNQAETVENQGAVVMTTVNMEMENDKIPLMSNSRCTKKSSRLQLIVNRLQNRIKFTSTSQKQNMERQESKKESTKSKGVDSGKRSEESSKPPEKIGKKRSKSKKITQKKNPNPTFIPLPSSNSSKKKKKSTKSGKLSIDETGLSQSFRNTPEEVEKAGKHLRILRFEKQRLNRAMNVRVMLKRLTKSEMENLKKLNNKSNNDDSNKSQKTRNSSRLRQCTLTDNKPVPRNQSCRRSSTRTTQKESIREVKNRLCTVKPKPHKYIVEAGKYFCQWPSVACKFKNQGMDAPSKILIHHRSHRRREQKLRSEKLDFKKLFCKICLKQLTNERYFAEHVKTHNNK